MQAAVNPVLSQAARALGSRGGRSTLRRYGTNRFRQLGRAGANKRWQGRAELNRAPGKARPREAT